jgi:taurine dioxygenase
MMALLGRAARRPERAPATGANGGAMVALAAPGSAVDPFADVVPAGVAIRPTGAALGAEVTGVDLSGDVDERTLQVVRDAVLRHGLVVLRGQDLSLDQQVAVTRRLHPLRPAAKKVNVYAPAGRPEVQVISNVVEDGRRTGFSDAGRWWHSDQSWTSNPELFIGLFAVRVPRRDGTPLGDTCWLSATAAYDALPPATRARLAGLRAVHSYTLMIERLTELGLLTRPPMTAEQAREVVDVEQPVVRVHPITGRPILYVNESFTRHVTGLAADESRDLLDGLFAHLARPDFAYRHTWQEGDFVLWDNSATQHLAVFDYGDLPRRLHRCGTDGPRTEPSVGAPVPA